MLRDTLNLRFNRLFELADSLRVPPDSLPALSIRWLIPIHRLVAMADSMRVPVDSVGPVYERERYNPLAAQIASETAFTYGSTYSIEKDAKADTYRALRLVRSRAAEWHLDPHRIGVMGFSAGGELAGMVSYESGDGNASAADPVDRVSGRPDFSILIYPGPLAVPASMPAAAPPAFLAAASDDPCCAVPTLKLLQMYRDAGIPVEAHIPAKGGHGFNMGQRSKLKAVNTWPARLADWLSDSGLLH